MAENIVKFGLKNVYIAVETEADVYDTPFALPGAVNLSREPAGDTSSFYADDRNYYESIANQGYTGELEIAVITEQFEKEVLGLEMEEETFVAVEKRDAKTKKFAMAFEIDGDKYHRRYWQYGCTATRPTTEAGTKSDTVEPQTDTLTLNVAGLADGTIGIKTTEKTPETVLNKWFEKVRMPNDGVGE